MHTYVTGMGPNTFENTYLSKIQVRTLKFCYVSTSTGTPGEIRKYIFKYSTSTFTVSMFFALLLCNSTLKQVIIMQGNVIN